MNPDAERISSAGPTDDALIASAQAGDRSAFGEIVRRYQRAVYRVAWALVRNAADADDLAQETFVRAWGAIGRFDRSLPLYPWLARITTNLAFSLFRSRKRRPETPLEPLLEAGRQWGVDDDPAEHVARDARATRLRECFAALAPEHQAVLALRTMQDLSYDAIAKTLNVPVGTVMSRLSRARAELKRRMQEGTGTP